MQESEHRDRALTAALRAVAEEEAGLCASAAVEALLLAEVRELRPWHRRHGGALYAIAAALVVAVGLPVWRMASPRLLTGTASSASGARADAPAGEATTSGSRAAASTGEVATDFLPLVYSRVPTTDAHIVRLEVPRAALASFGLTSIDAVDDSRAGTVLADVLVGEDGLARFVRFVRPLAN